MSGTTVFEEPSTPASLSPTRAALASASEKAAAKPGQVIVGPLRIRVLQAIDLPTPRVVENGTLTTSSWLHFPGRRPSQHQTGHGKAQHEAVADTICVLLQAANSGVFATEARPWASAICWDEEFYMEKVSSSDELVLFCVDRARDETHASLPLQGEISACPGFIGKVTLPLTRLPEGQEVEQWYPLVPEESSSALRTALRVSLCFVPNGVPVPVSQSPERRRVTPTSALPPSPATEISSPSPVSKQLRVDISEAAISAAIPLESGIIDYVIVVGTAVNSDIPTSLDEAQVRFRYPLTDRHNFPLPTKIEWFCFPGGPEIIAQAERPQSKLFSFVLVGGNDGLCRCYVVCLVVYHRRPKSGGAEENEWHATCVAFLTRIPLIQEVTTCLLVVARTWMAANGEKETNGTDESRLADTRNQLFSLCHDITLPVRGVFGVQFAVHNVKVRLMVPSMTSIYMMKEPARPELRRTASAQGRQASPTKARSFIAINQGFQPLVYSLEPIFQLFDIKTIVHLVTLVLCEYRILIHSTQQSLLCPVAEGLCALTYPFRWQHPYVPILPRVLSEYLQAPLPYILGIHTSWLQSMLENGRPEHLVVVDIDRGTIQLQESGGPVLPHKLATALHHSLKTVLHPSLYGDMEDNRRGSQTNIEEGGSSTDSSLDELKQEVEKEQRTVVEWGPDTEKQVRMEFVCFLSSLVRGYRECLFFVNQKLPVFNKRRFFESESTDNEVVPLVTRLLCTQAFQAFLESHSSAELSVFHSVYLTLCRGPKELQWSQSIRALTASKSQHSFLDSGPARTDIPVLVIEDASTNKKADDGDMCGSDDASEQETPKTTCSLFNDEDIGMIEMETSKTLGKTIEALLNEESAHPWDPFALETSDVEALSAAQSKSLGKLNHEFLARKLGVEPKLLKVNAHFLQNAHQVNQYRLHLDSTVAAALAGSAGPGGRFLSSEDERIEQMLHKCLTAVFTSDDSLTEQEIRACEAHFKSGHARDLFVLILMQPNNQYVERVNGSPKASGTKSSSAWYNPKGSGSCIGATGFRLLTRLTSALMKQCAIQEDYSTARGILQVAPQYYHYVEDKHSGIGFAKKEYLVTPLRLLPICRSLDLWQHAFICEIDAANQVDPTESDEEGPETVGDELFFSVIGSLMYDMLNFEVPLQKVLTFVTVMCSTYQKGQDLLDTLKQLAENVYRALDLSKDIKPSPPKDAVQPRINAKSTSNHTPAAPSQIELLPKTANGAGPSSSTAGVVFAESPMLSREYDLNTVIRRKMSVREMPQHGNSTFHAKTENRDDDRTGNSNQYAADWMSRTPPTRRRRSSAVFPSAVLTSSGSPVLCLATDGGRAACGMADAHVNVVDITPSEEDKGITLEGHHDAVVAVQMRGNALISGSRDHTLRAWDLRATPKKRNMFAFFSLAYATGSSNTMASTEDSEVDGATVSKRSLVMRGHLDAITCMELGHQLGVGRCLMASGSDDGTVRLWETTKESSVALLSGHKGTGKPADHGGVSCLRLLSSDDDLALGYRRRTLQIWDLAVCKLKVNVEAHQAGVRDLQVSGTRLVTAANDRVVKVWDTAFRGTGGTMQPVQVLRGHGGPVQCVSLGGPADPIICTGAADGLVRVWDLRYVQRGPRLTLRGHTGPVTRLQRDFTKLVSAGEDGWLRVWDMHSGLCLREKQVHTSGITCLEMRDSLVYSGSWDGSVRVWDIENIARVYRFVLTARGCTSSYSFIPKRHSDRMPKVAELPARLQSLDSLSPLSSPASSLPSVYSPGPVAAAREKKSQSLANQTRKRRVKPKARQTKIEEVSDDRDSFGTTAFLRESHDGECLLNGPITDKDGDQTSIRNEDENSSWPVLVAVRCRPRKRQRAKGRFATVLGADDEVQRSDSLDSSSASSSGDVRGSNDRSSSGSVQRGVFEYSTCRDYDDAATYDAKIPPPRMQRPRRLYVQTPGDSGGSTSGRRSFDFDFIFPPWKKQRDVYDMCVHAQIRHVLQSQREGQAQHSTIVAYGQTGTGKTYTMGMLSDFRDDKEQGLIPRALSQVLEFAGNSEDEADSHQTVVTLSFLQIYLETIQDLLALPGSNLSTTRGKPRGKHDARRHCNASSNDLPVRQGRDGAFYVTDLNEYEISSIEDAHALLELAMRNRVLAATTKNKTSSRSHTLLTISIKRRRHGPSRSRYSSSEDEDDDLDENKSANEEDKMKKASTISFVDLAGSERVDGALHFLRATRTRQEQRIREAKFINRSLSALGGVIAALAQPKPAGTGATSANVVARLNSGLQEKLQHPVGNEQARPHIRFRDSQLTKLLQGRLMGSRGRLLLIATVDDQPKNLSETLSTLKFAAQCRRVELQPGPRLRGDRANRLRRQKSLLDQVFNDMKTMHENREAALHSEYQARITALEGELEAARAAALSSPHSTPEDVASIHLASYTALCSLVDTICSTDDHSGESQHPSAAAFENDKDLLEYVAGLYSRLKEALIVQQQQGESPATPVATGGPVSIAKTNPASLLQPAVKDQRYDEHKHEPPLELAANEQEVSREPVPTPTPSTVNSSTRRARARIQLSPEQEAEFRAVARHLIATQALDSFMVSSSSDEGE